MNAGALMAWLPSLALAAALSFALMAIAGARASGEVVVRRWRAGSKSRGRQAIRKAGRSYN